MEECTRVAGKRPVSVWWVDVDQGIGFHRSRVVAKDFGPESRLDDVEALQRARSCSSTLERRTSTPRLRECAKVLFTLYELRTPASNWEKE